MPERVDIAGLLAPLTVPGPIANVIERFRDVAAAVPDRVAVADAGGSLTYAELDRLTTALVAVLDRELPAGDAPVGVFVGHRADAVVLALAVVKSGRVLVMLDQHLPAARLRHVIEIGGIATVISDEGVGSAGHEPPELAETGVDVLAWGEVRAAADAMSTQDLESVDLERGLRRRGRDTVVVVFTSGSTGKPKGVVVTHDQLLNDVAHIGRSFRMSPDDRNALVFPLSFVAGIVLDVQRAHAPVPVSSSTTPGTTASPASWSSSGSTASPRSPALPTCSGRSREPSTTARS